MRLQEAVIKRIFEICKEYDMSINELCRRAGLTQSTVNNIVSGRNNSTKISTIKRICDGIDLPISKFFVNPLFDDLEQEIK